MRPTPNALSTIRCRSQSVPSRLRPMVTGTGDAAVAGSVVTSSSASAAHDRCGTSLMEALLLGAGEVLIEAMEWEPGLGEAAGHSRKGEGDANATAVRKSAGLRFATASEKRVAFSAFAARNAIAAR